MNEISIYLPTYLSTYLSIYLILHSQAKKKSSIPPWWFDTSWFLGKGDPEGDHLSHEDEDMITLPETNSKFAPENGGLEDDYCSFLLKECLFSGANC